MLRVVIRSELIAEAQRSYRERATYADLTIADQIRQMRLFLEAGARRFGDRQAHARRRGKPYLENGRGETLEAELFGPLARNGWPSRVGGILYGLKLSGRIAMEEVAAPVGIRPLGERDPHSYWALLQDGPDQARTFGDLVGIAVYFDPFDVIEVIWVGRARDAQGALNAMLDVTNRLSAWSWHPAYAAWLAGDT